MTSRPRSLATALLGAAVLLGALPLSCGRGEDTPEGQVRALVASAEEAAEAKDLGSLGAMIAEGYTDGGGNSRDAVLSILRYHFLRSQSIHLLTRIGALSFPSPSIAEVTLYVAMAADPIPGAEHLELLRADLYRFDVVFSEVERRSWKLIRASWRPAAAADFL